MPALRRAVGENHFQGLPYTAAQPKIAPGETEKLAEQFRPYTRTTYMGSGEPEGDVLSRTTYRPVLDEESASAPEDGEAPTQEALLQRRICAEAEAAENRGNGVEALFDEPKGKDDAEDGAAPSSESDAQEDGEAEAVEDAVDIDPRKHPRRACEGGR